MQPLCFNLLYDQVELCIESFLVRGIGILCFYFIFLLPSELQSLGLIDVDFQVLAVLTQFLERVG